MSTSKPADAGYAAYPGYSGYSGDPGYPSYPTYYEAFPQIDTGTHAGQIGQLIATTQGRLVSAGDTTLRVWHAAERRLQRLLLGQVSGSIDDSAVDGTVLRMAVSPDGRWAAVIKPWRHRTLAARDAIDPATGDDNGWVAELQLFDLASGNLRARFVQPGRWHDLDFSPDGRWLAVVGERRVARLRQVELQLLATRDLLRRGDQALPTPTPSAASSLPPAPVATWQLGKPLRAAGLPAALRFVPAPAAHTKRRGQLTVMLAAEAPVGQGQLAWLTVSPAGALACERVVPMGGPIRLASLAVNASMAVVAGAPDQGRKRRGTLAWTRHDGQQQGTLDTEAPVASAAFSPDGSLLATGLMADAVNGEEPPSGLQVVQVNVYDTAVLAAPSLRSSYYGHDGSVWAVAFIDDKTVASAGGDNQAIHFWRPDRRVAECEGAIRGIGRAAYQPGITADERVQFGTLPERQLPPGHPPRQQSFDLRRLRLDTTAASRLRPCDTQSRKWRVSGDDSPVIGLTWRGPDGCDTAEGPPDLNLFVGADGSWVVWTASGYYDSGGGPDAARRIGYRVNRGPAQEALLVPSDRFKAFYRPDIVRLVVRHGSEAAARAHGADIPPVNVTHVLPPILELAAGGLRVGDDGRLGFTLDIECPCPGVPLTRVSVQRNGRVLWVKAVPPGPPRARRRVVVPPLPLLPGRNRFSVHAENPEARSVPLEFEQEGPTPDLSGPTPLDAPGQLFLLCVGVSEFADAATRPLKFAHLDAQAVHDAFVHGRLRPRAGGRQRAVAPGNQAFEAVNAVLLQNRAATKTAILAALDQMVGTIQDRHRQAGAERDVLFVFLSSHGVRVTDHGVPSLFFQNHDMVVTAERVDETGVSMLDLGDRITSVPAEVVLVLDACRAGLAGRGVVSGLDADEVVRRVQAIHERAMYVIGASQADELAREDRTNQLGVLTVALLEALGARQPTAGTGRGAAGVEVLMADLLAGVQRLAPEVSARAGVQAQTPVCRSFGEMLPLTILKI